MGFYIIDNDDDELETISEETFKKAMEIITDMVEQPPMFKVTYNEDGTIPITVENVYALKDGIYHATSVEITPEEALDALFQYNEEILDEQL